jgi:hypothetical protein
MRAATRPAARIAVAGALVGCALGSIAACASSGGTPAPTSPSPPAGLTTAQAQAALLTVAEIGNGLQVSDLQPQEYPLPCTPNAKPLSKIIAPAAHATATWSDATDSIEVTETINNYGDDATVQHALDLTEAGMRCRSGQVGSIPVTIGKPQDLSHNIKAAVDGIEAWAVSSSASHQTVILAKIDTQLITLVFGELPGTPKNALDAVTIVQDAMAKVSEATQ